MTFGVLGKDEPLLAELIALAFESAGHDCLVFEDIGHASRMLQAVRFDSIILAIHTHGGNGLDWLQTLSAIRSDLPSRTLLLTNTTLTPDEAARIEKLGAEVGGRPHSVVGVQQLVMGRMQKARFERAAWMGWDETRGADAESLH
jgi:CheY-like chemotaxis protein